jgi:hypothetical protein
VSLAQQTNLTVMKADGTTSVTYTAIQPASGDRQPAIWRNEAVGTAISHRPRFSLSSRKAGNGDGRWLDYEYYYPSTVTGADGRISVAFKLVHKGSVLVLDNQPAVDIAEGVAQSINLLDHPDVVAAIKSQFAPT